MTGEALQHALAQAARALEEEDPCAAQTAVQDASRLCETAASQGIRFAPAELGTLRQLLARGQSAAERNALEDLACTGGRRKRPTCPTGLLAPPVAARRLTHRPAHPLLHRAPSWTRITNRASRCA